ncbi:MAG: 3-beta hydroxysteroid dehydrogenase [Pseudonocardiales bacterium]|nr:MAG: 3-beta hydroxysteroid dehydrogenase [Pseudonocardiales bacterium]
MRVAVVGGTGQVGRHVVSALEAAGHDPVVVTRSRGVDVLSGDGLGAALVGAQAVVDASNIATGRRGRAVRFFTQVTERLLVAEERAGVGHHVALSIVGIDDIDWGYYDGKRQQERLVTAGPVPWSVLRATQFHEFPDQVLASARLGPLAIAPMMRMQPVAASEVGAVLADLAVGPPAGRAPDLGGPEAHTLADLARRLFTARGQRVRVVPVRLPGAAGRAMATGGLLPGPGARLGKQTFDEWLAADLQKQQGGST